MKQPKRIMGIDPGTNILGYAFIDIINKKPVLHNLGVVRLDKYKDHHVKLLKIHERLCFLIESFVPHEMGVEAPFYGKNVQSMLKLGRAQGAAITAGMINGLSVTEYSPKSIKQSITGSGNASKEQVAAMLQQMLKLVTMPKYFDATDALGVAVCHHLKTSSPLAKKLGGNYTDWKAYIKANPDKIK